MAITPLITRKVQVSATASFAGPSSKGAASGKAVVFNVGPALIFVRPTHYTGPGAVVDTAYPIPAGGSQSLHLPCDENYGISLIAAEASVAYVSFVRGNLET